MAGLKHLIYASRATGTFTKDGIVELLEIARENNERLHVTGMLLFDSGSFLQVLEGEEDVVKNLFSNIAKDDRHDQIVEIISEAIAERHFPNWSMGYASLPREELETIEGMNDFFAGNSCLADIDGGRARKILMAFASGRWRLT